MRTRYAPRNRPAHPLRLAALRALLRHVPLLLPALRRAHPRLHAAPGAAGDRRLPPGVVGGALRGRERPRGHRGGARVGGRGLPLRHARAAPLHRGRHRARPPPGQAGGAGRARRCRAARSTTRTPISSRSARWATRPTRSSRWLDEHTGAAGRRSSASTPATRLPLTDFPLPAYHLIALRQYFISSIQFSSGCPYTCEFCDIPALYGRNPRLKTAAQVLAELDALVAGGAVAIYFVDDNFIANQKAALELLPHLVDVAAAQPVPGALRVRGHAQHREERARARPDARRRLQRGLLRDRDARAGRAPLDVQGPEPPHADPGRGRQAERLRARGGLRHHPGARHRHARRPRAT